MLKYAAIFMIAAGVFLYAASEEDGENMSYRELSAFEESVIVNGGTERAFTGEYVDTFENGIYTCRRCHSYCGI